jgi:hypothetical protein
VSRAGSGALAVYDADVSREASTVPGGFLVAQGVQGAQIVGVRASGGRHATRVRYRGRHRRPRAQGRTQAGVRLAFTAACAALLVCLPQPSWADRAGTAPSRSTAASQAMVKSLPVPVGQKLQG